MDKFFIVSKLLYEADMTGLADKKKFSEQDADPNELAMGLKVEKEHSMDESITKQIALDHLSEIPDYYTRLAKMEKEAKQSGTNEQ